MLGSIRGTRAARLCPKHGPLIRQNNVSPKSLVRIYLVQQQQQSRSISLIPNFLRSRGSSASNSSSSLQSSLDDTTPPSPGAVAAILPLEASANALLGTRRYPIPQILRDNTDKMGADIVSQDPQSPVLKSDAVFEIYLYALKELGKSDTFPAAVTRRETLAAAASGGVVAPLAEGVISKSQEIADRVAAGTSTIASIPGSNSQVSQMIQALNSAGANLQNNGQQPVLVSLVTTRGSVLASVLRYVVGGTAVIFVIYVIAAVVVEKSGLLKAGASNVKSYEPLTSNPTRFTDVHGIDEVKDDLQDIVEFLKDPTMFSTLGGKLPKGVMLTGPPGTGKTLLARAVAGEAGVPFFFASGSDFEEMFVGVGAKRVRDLFAAARKQQPSIIFIDELDAVGGKRVARDSQYMKQTLNQLLVEMDGFQQTDGIIVMAATNTPETLDSALTRPGRFDKIIAVPLPDIKGRVQIIRHHLKNVTIDPLVDIKRLAQGTTTFTGADLQNMINQAAIQAAKEGAKSVDLNHFEWAIDKIVMGAEMKSAFLNVEEKTMTAYHEAGHALVSLYTEGAIPLHKVTCNRRGNALGYTAFLPKDDMYSVTYDNYVARIDVALGGRLAEEIVYGFNKSTSGCSSDLSGAMSIADSMVKRSGMSKDVGLVYYSENYPPMSDSMKEKIDAAVQLILTESQSRVRKLLEDKQEELHILAKALLEHETLDADQVRRILKGETLPSIREVLSGDVPPPPEVADEEEEAPAGRRGVPIMHNREKKDATNFIK